MIIYSLLRIFKDNVFIRLNSLKLDSQSIEIRDKVPNYRM